MMLTPEGTQMIKNGENRYQLSQSTCVFMFPEYEDLGNAGIVATEEGVILNDQTRKKY